MNEPLDSESIAIIQEYIWNLPPEEDYVVQLWSQTAHWYYLEYWFAESLESAKARIELNHFNPARVVQIIRYTMSGVPQVKRVAWVTRDFEDR